MYKLYTTNTGNQFVIRLADNAYIPVNQDNADYQAFLLWKSQGNEPLPAESN